MKVLFAINNKQFGELFSQAAVKKIADSNSIINLDTLPDLIGKKYILQYIENADIVITSWGSTALDTDIINKARKLKLLIHAAGSVKPVTTKALWQKNIKVVSCAEAIAYGVAEFCLGLILLVPKRVFWACQETKKGRWREGIDVFGGAFELYRQNIGIIGVGTVGKHLVRLLHNFDCDISVYDPFLSDEETKLIKVKKVDNLEDIFQNCRIVSLNAPSTEKTRNMIRAKHFSLLKEGSVFINTSRGDIVNEKEMIEELSKHKFIACLDVTYPEPPLENNPLRKMPNVILTPHIAGVISENKLRIGDLAADEIIRFISGSDSENEVSLIDLERTG